MHGPTHGGNLGLVLGGLPLSGIESCRGSIGHQDGVLSIDGAWVRGRCSRVVGFGGMVAAVMGICLVVIGASVDDFAAVMSGFWMFWSRMGRDMMWNLLSGQSVGTYCRNGQNKEEQPARCHC